MEGQLPSPPLPSRSAGLPGVRLLHDGLVAGPAPGVDGVARPRGRGPLRHCGGAHPEGAAEDAGGGAPSSSQLT